MVNFMKSVFLSLQTPRAASPLFAALMVLASLPLTAPARATIASDDTQAVQAAVNAAIKANKPLIIPAGATYFLKGSIRISGPLPVHCQPRTKFLLDFDPNFDPHDAADAAAFSITSSNVTIDGCWFDGDNLGTNVLQPGSVGRMAIWLEGSSTKPLRNVIIENDTFTNLTQYGGTQPASLPASHAVYGTELDTFVYENNTVDNISGSALHIEACSNATVTGNNIHQTGWASIVFYGDCHFSSITNNTITGNGPDTRYWGGSIDVFSSDSTGLPPNSNIVIDGNYISGVHMYGAAIRVGSAQYITVTNNQLIDISSGSVDLVSGIGMTPRVMPATASSSCTTAPFDNCANGRNMFYNIISGNTIESLGTNAIGIYIIGETIPLNQIVGNLGVSHDFTITNNQILSVDDDNYFQNCIIIHGGYSGITDVTVEGNTCKVRTTDPPAVLAGAIRLAVYPASDKNPTPAVLQNIKINSNNVVWFGSPAPTKSQSAYGIYIGPGSPDVQILNNALSGWYDGIYVYPQP